MPTITEAEDRLRHTLQAVASSVHHSEGVTDDVAHPISTTATPPATGGIGRSKRRSPLLVFAASFLAVLLAGAISILTGGTESGGDLDQPVEPSSSSDPVPVTTVPSSADEASPSTTTPPVEPSATAEFWAKSLAGWVDTVSRMDTFGPDEPDPEARVIESQETGDPFGDGGSMVATVETADGQLTIRAEYRGRGAAIDETVLEAEMSDLTADGIVQHVDTIWHSPDTDAEASDEDVQADYFLTELEPESAQMTVLTVRGRLVVDLDTTDPALLFNTNQLTGIATAMNGTSLDLTWNPDHPLSNVVEPLPEPAADDWVALDDDIWVASGEGGRLWVKSDVQDPTPANSTDTRSLYLYAGSDFVVIVVGAPVPDAITVTWDDGSTESVEPIWNTDLGMGFARFVNKAAQVVSVDGP